MSKNFVQRSALHRLIVLDAEFMTFQSEHIFEIEAEVHERFYQRQYTWTGSSSGFEMIPELQTTINECGVPNHKIHGDIIAEGDFRIYLVDLGRRLEPGERDTIRVNHILRDLEGKFRPTLSVTPSPMRNAIDQLILELEVPLGTVTNVRHERTQGPEKKVTGLEKLTPVHKTNESETYTVEIKEKTSPNQGHRICWDIIQRGS